MLTPRRIRFWYKVHKWTSLICTAFLLMECLTGLPLIFSPDIYKATHSHVPAAIVPANTPLTPLDALVAAGKLKYPHDKILFLSWAEEEPRVFLSMASNYDPAIDEARTLVFDAHTGNLLEEDSEKTRPKRDVPGTTINILFFLHTTLFAKLYGKLFLGCMALLFLVALVSGALVYGPFMRRLDFGTIRKDKSTRLKWFDLHNLLGIVTLSWAFVVGATGIINTLSDPLFDLWSSRTMPGLLAPYRNKSVPTSFTSVDEAVATAHKALPQMKVTSIGFPNPQSGRPRSYVIWTRGDTPVTSRLFTPVLIDAGTGQLMAAKALPWYLRVLEVSRPLHFGDYGGLLLKAIWALFDIALIVVLLSGVYLWLSRRKAPVEKELDRLVKLEEFGV